MAVAIGKALSGYRTLIETSPFINRSDRTEGLRGVVRGIPPMYGNETSFANPMQSRMLGVRYWSSYAPHNSRVRCPGSPDSSNMEGGSLPNEC